MIKSITNFLIIFSIFQQLDITRFAMKLFISFLGMPQIAHFQVEK